MKLSAAFQKIEWTRFRCLCKQWDLDPDPEYTGEGRSYWIGELDPSDLFNMRGDIGPLRASKGEPMSRLVDRLEEVDDQTFRNAIERERASKAVLVYVPQDGLPYAADGNKRVLNAVRHGESGIQALVIEVPEVDRWA